MAYKPKKLAVADGGTGAATLTNHGVVIGQATSAVAVTSAGTAGQVLTSNGAGADPTFQAGGGSGTVTSVSVTTANGVSGSVATATTTPAITLTLGAITPSSVNASGAITSGALFTASAGQKFARTARGAGNYTILVTDHLIGKTAQTGGGDTLTLPVPGTAGTGAHFFIKDEGGGFATDNCTVNVSGGANIDGASTYVMDTNFGLAGFYTDGSNYFVM